MLSADIIMAEAICRQGEKYVAQQEARHSELVKRVNGSMAEIAADPEEKRLWNETHNMQNWIDFEWGDLDKMNDAAAKDRIRMGKLLASIYKEDPEFANNSVMVKQILVGYFGL